MTKLGICYLIIAGLALLCIVLGVLAISTAREYAKYRRNVEPQLAAMLRRWADETGERENEQW